MPKNNFLKRGQTGHTYVKRDYGKYTLFKCDNNGKYHKVMDSLDYEDIRPHRHDNHRKNEFKPKEPIPLAEYREKASTKHKQSYQNRVKKLDKNKDKIPSKSQGATLAASDKALQKIPKPDKLVIAEQNRPQKVRVQLDSKTSVMVYPNQVENALQRYNQRYRQSQEQANTKQRVSHNKGKKQTQNDTIYAY